MPEQLPYIDSRGKAMFDRHELFYRKPYLKHQDVAERPSVLVIPDHWMKRMRRWLATAFAVGAAAGSLATWYLTLWMDRG